MTLDTTPSLDFELNSLQRWLQSPGNNSLLAQAIEQSPFGVVVMNLAGQVEYCNHGFLSMSGFTPSEVVGVTPNPWDPDGASVTA